VAWSFVLPFTASCWLIPLRLAILFSSFAARRASFWTSFSMSRCGNGRPSLCGLCPTSSSIARRLSQAAAGGLHRSRTRPASRRPSYNPGCQSLPAGFSEAAPLMSGRIWISTCAAAGLFTVMSRLLTATATTSPSSSFLPDPDVPAAPPPKDRYERCAV
jgi:hypothetical protein